MEVPVVEMVPPVRPTSAVLRAAFVGLDEWNLEEVFSHRGAVMHVVPRFLWGSFRVAMKLALEEILSGAERRDVMQQERGWKNYHVAPSYVALQISERRAHPKREVGGPV